MPEKRICKCSFCEEDDKECSLYVWYDNVLGICAEYVCTDCWYLLRGQKKEGEPDAAEH